MARIYSSTRQRVPEAAPSREARLLAESGGRAPRSSNQVISRFPQFARSHRTPGSDAPAPTVAVHLVLLIAFCACLLAATQSALGRQQSQIKPPTDAPASSNPDDDLQIGTNLTRQGHFHEAIPHLLAAQGRVSNQFAADFNLALCYTATNQFEKAITILGALSSAAPPTAAVYNLLAQAYVGNSQPEQALTALQKAAALSPSNEKLYLLVADACMDHQNYALGVKVVNLGMQNLPHSARLFYERGVFQTLLERGDLAAADFAEAARLAPDTEIAYLASAQQNLVEGKIPETIARIRRSPGRLGKISRRTFRQLAFADRSRQNLSNGRPLQRRHRSPGNRAPTRSREHFRLLAPGDRLSRARPTRASPENASNPRPTQRSPSRQNPFRTQRPQSRHRALWREIKRARQFTCAGQSRAETAAPPIPRLLSRK
jgi:tetratricopeptide (TPR) repeat protein